MTIPISSWRPCNEEEHAHPPGCLGLGSLTAEQYSNLRQHVSDRGMAERLFFWARPPGLPIEHANRSIERFAKEVIPLVEAAARV